MGYSILERIALIALMALFTFICYLIINKIGPWSFEKEYGMFQYKFRLYGMLILSIFGFALALGFLIAYILGYIS